MQGDLVVIDLETTGLDPANDAIIEVGAVRYGSAFGAERAHTALQGSLMVFFTPRQLASLYVLGGGTVMGRDVQDTYWDGQQAQLYEKHSPVLGGHVGVGLEISPVDAWFVDIEGRYIEYATSIRPSPALAGAIQTSLTFGHRF